MYFDKLYKEMKNFAAVIDGADQLYKATVKQIQKDYGTSGNLYVQKIAEAKAVYEETKRKAYNDGMKVVKESMENAEKAIDEFVVKPVPEDFSSTIETLKFLDDELSNEDAKIFIPKYKKNYLASKAINKIMREKGVEYTVVSANELKADLARMKGMAEKYFKEYTDGNYLCAVLIQAESPLTRYDEELRVFIHEDVTKYCLE